MKEACFFLRHSAISEGFYRESFGGDNFRTPQCLRSLSARCEKIHCCGEGGSMPLAKQLTVAFNRDSHRQFLQHPPQASRRAGYDQPSAISFQFLHATYGAPAALN
jgi:hypothetical protein